MIFSFYRYILALICFLFSINTFSQTIVSITDGNVQVCNGILYDTGGAGGSGYSDNESFTLVICPDNPGDVVSLVFNSFTLSNVNTAPSGSNADNLAIFDGDNTSATSLGTYYGNQLQGLVVTTTSSNTTGCLTLVFNSNDVGVGVFSATITCSTPCQPPVASFSQPTVAQNPQKICQGEVVNFDASSSFAQFPFSISSYVFDYGDGVVDTLSSPLASHSFANGPGEYLVDLTIIDDNGCTNLNSEVIKVWVSTDPNFNTIISDPIICLGESACIDGSQITPTTYVPYPGSSVSGGTYLPDDVGACFSATIDFDNFNPGQQLVDINDLIDICVEIEHTYMGDLVGTITCPDGTSVVLHQQGGSNTNLGDPIHVDDSTQIGVGWEYCWSPTATNGTWVDNSDGSGSPNTMPNSSTGTTGENSLIPGTYESLNPLTTLVGCPLNGVWELEFCDLLGSDDGFVFDFSIELDPNIYPSLTTFTPSIGLDSDSTFWTANLLELSLIDSVSTDGNLICLTPLDTGIYYYTFNATDDFGCTYDTTVSIIVEPGPSVNAGNDTFACFGNEVQLTASGDFNEPQSVNGCSSFTIDMHDSFGDGWNGFQIEVVINGVSVGFYTFINGSDNQATFNVAEGDAIYINTISGAYDSEVSYEIEDCNGNVIFAETSSSLTIGNNVWDNYGGGNLPSDFNFNWTPTVGLDNPTIYNPTITVTAQQTYVVEIWETGHQSCATFDTLLVDLVIGLSAGDDGDTSVCKTYSPFDMFNVLEGSPSSGGVWVDELGSSVSNMFDPQIHSTGNYLYIVGAVDCADTAYVFVNNPNEVSINSTSPDTTICINGTATISAQASNGFSPYNLVWSNGLIGNGPHSVTPAIETTYYVYALDSLGCISQTDSLKVDFFDPIQINSIPTDTVCFGPQANVTSITANAIGGLGTGFTYEWYNFNNQFIDNTQSINVSPQSNPGVYTVYVGDNCTTPKDTMIATVYLYDVVRPAFVVDTTSGCQPFDVVFTNINSPSLYDSLYWSFGNGDTSTFSGPISVNYSSAGCFDVRLELTTSNGCFSELDSINVICGYDYPIADFEMEPQPTNVSNPNISFTNLSFGNDINYWNFTSGEPSFSSEINDYAVFPSDSAGVYPVELIVLNSFGCKDSTYKEVIIHGLYLLYLPNAFTPDGNGLNETFRPYGEEVDFVDNYNMKIFNRWGEKIYETNEVDKGWDGSYKGEKVPAGVYVWKIEAKELHGKKVHKTMGSVTLIR